MSGSSEAYLDFVRPHWRRLHLAARQYVARGDDAGDLVQEVLLRAWRNFSPADDRVYHRAWLFAIMRNVALEWHRTRKRRIRLVPAADGELTELAAIDPTEAVGEFPGLDERQFREFLDERVAGALDALEGQFREVLILSVAGGLNYREIAEVLDCPMGTVMSRMARARRTLREQLAGYAQSERRHREVRR